MSDIQEIDFSVNLLRALLWQYDDAETLQSIVTQKNAWFYENHTQFWDNWYTDVFNLETANQFGLAVWGIILNLRLYVNQPPPPPEVPIFGFDGSDGVNFDNGIFGSSGGQTVILSQETQRLALRLRYLQLTTAGCVPEINRALKVIFAPYGRVFLQDYGTMSQAYTFDFELPFEMKYLFDNYDILPRPAGVKSGYIEIVTGRYFGFDGGYHTNFDRGIFGSNI